jgi:hypothetical protein
VTQPEIRTLGTIADDAAAALGETADANEALYLAQAVKFFRVGVRKTPPSVPDFSPTPQAQAALDKQAGIIVTVVQAREVATSSALP